MPPRMLMYRWFARMYGWDPEQVDRQPIDVLVWFPAIEDAEAEVDRRRQDQEIRAAQAGTRR